MKNRLSLLWVHIRLVRSCPTRLSVLSFSVAENIRQRQAHLQNPSYLLAPLCPMDLLCIPKSTVGCVLIPNRNKDPDMEMLEGFRVQSDPLQLGLAADNGWEQGLQWRILLLRISNCTTEGAESCRNTSVEIQEEEVQQDPCQFTQIHRANRYSHLNLTSVVHYRSWKRPFVTHESIRVWQVIQ